MATIRINPGDNVGSKISNASNGDTVLIEDGVYRITQSSKITVNVPNLTIKAARSRDNKEQGTPRSGVIFDGGWNTSERDSGVPTANVDWYLMLIKANGVKLEGVQFRYAPSRAIGIEGADNVTITNCKTYQSYKQACMVRNSDTAIIQDSWFERASQMIRHQKVSGNRWSASCVLRTKTKNSKFRRNVVYEAHREGFIFGPECEDCEAYDNELVNINLLYAYITTSKNVDYYNNIHYKTSTYGNGLGFRIKNESQFGSYNSSGIHIYNNCWIGNNLAVTQQWTGSDCVIEHNTFYNSGGVELRKPASGFSRGNGNIFRNNILNGNSSLSNDGGSSFSAYNNPSGSLSNPTTNLSYPVTKSRFHQAAGSNSINAARNSGVSVDYRGARRVNPDCGWHEYDGSVPPTVYTLTANFTASDTEPGTGDTVNFTDTSTVSTGAIDGWKWEVSDDNGSTWEEFSLTEDPSYTFDTAGDYLVRLTVYDYDESESATRTRAISVADAAPASLDVRFSVSNWTPDTDEAVTLTSNTSGGSTPYTYAWSDNAGNGNAWFSSTSAASVTWTPTSVGDYTITLQVTDNVSTVDSLDKTLTVTAASTTDDAVVASFTVSDSTPVRGESFTLTDASTDFGAATIDDWSWEVSLDGGQTFAEIDATSGPVAYTPTRTGEHIFRLTVQDVSEALSDSYSRSLFVEEPTPTEDTDNLISNGDFADDDTDWTYTQGSGGTSSFNVWDVDGDGDDEGRIKIVTEASGDLLKQSSVSITSGVEYRLSFDMWAKYPATVTVAVTDSGGSSEGLEELITLGTDNQRYSFDFVAESTNASAQLRITPELTSGVNYFMDNFKLVPISSVPDINASFSIDDNTVESGATVTLTDASTGPVVAWSWDADGTEFSTAQNTTYTVSGAGNVTITLTITDADGNTDTASRVVYVSVPEPPGPSAGANPQITVDVLNTSTGNQTFTFGSEYDAAPAGCLFVISGATANDTEADGGLLGFGATDGTNEWAVCTYTQHNVASTLTRSRGVTDKCILTIDNSGVTGEASFGSLATTGVTVSVDDAFPSAYKVMAIPLPYTDVQVGTFTLNSNETGTVDVALPWDATDTTDHNTLILYWSMDGSINDSAINQSEYSIGYSYDLANHQHCMWRKSGSGSDPGGVVFGRAITNRIAWSASTLDVDWSASVEHTASGFTVTTRDANVGTKDIAYIAIDLGQLNAYTNIMYTPTTTTTVNVSPGFNIGAGLILGSMLPYANLTNKFNDAGSLAFGAFDQTGDYCAVITDEDGADPSNTQSLFATVALEAPYGDGTAGIQAAATIDGATVDFSYTAVEDSARSQLIVLLEGQIGEADAAEGFDAYEHGLHYGEGLPI